MASSSSSSPLSASTQETLSHIDLSFSPHSSPSSSPPNETVDFENGFVPLVHQDKFCLESRWTPIFISALFDVKVVNVQQYDDHEQVNQSGLFIGKKKVDRFGMLKNADLQFTFALPQNVHKEKLTAWIADSRFEVFSSFVTNVQVGAVSLIDEPLEQKSGSVDAVHMATMTIPLFRELSKSIPLFDQINYDGAHVTHKTVEIKGYDSKTNKTVTHYIRIKIIEAESKVEISSVTTNVIDAVRIHENWDSVKKACSDFSGWTRRLFSNCRSKREKAPAPDGSAVQYHSVSQIEYNPTPALDVSSSSSSSSSTSSAAPSNVQYPTLVIVN